MNKVSVRDTVFPRFGEDKIEIYSFKKPEVSETDQTFYRSNEDLVNDFIATGKALTEIRKLRYDFENGVDTGEKLEITRNTYAPDLCDVSQAINDSKESAENIARMINAQNDLDKTAETVAENVNKTDA